MLRTREVLFDQVTKRTRRRLRRILDVEGERCGVVVRCDLLTFGAANLWTLSTYPELVDRITPGWAVAGRLPQGSPGPRPGVYEL